MQMETKKTFLLGTVAILVFAAAVEADYAFFAYRSGSVDYHSHLVWRYGDVYLGRATGDNERGFIVFDLSTLDLSDEFIVEAELTLHLILDRSHDPSVAFGVYDVGSIPPLNSPSTIQLQEIYDDIGSGTLYGTATAYNGQSDPFSFVLPEEAINDITAASGGEFAMGLARLGVVPNQGYLENYIAIGPGLNITIIPPYVPSLQLTVAPIPEPSTLLLLIAGGSGVFLKRRPRTGAIINKEFGHFPRLHYCYPKSVYFKPLRQARIEISRK